MEDSEQRAWAGASAGGSWESERALRREAEASAERLARLQAATAALSGARTPDEVAAVALGAGLEALGGARGVVLVADDRSGLRVLRATGLEEEHAAALAAAPEPNALVACLRTAEPVFVEDLAAQAGRQRGLAAAAAPGRCGALAALPLVFEGRATGVLAVGFDGARAFPPADRGLAIALAGQCAQALERARLFAAERISRAEAVAARRRLAFLDEVSAHLAESGGEGEMLDGIARLSVPALGEWVGLFVCAEGGEGLALAAEAGAAPVGAAAQAALRADPLGRLARCCRGGDPAIVEDLDPGPAALLVPLRVKGRSLGSLVVASGPGRRSGLEELALAAHVAHRTALAVENARLLDEATRAARAREEFLHVASHELRGPVGTLGLTLQLLARDVKKGAVEAAAARLRAVERQAQRLVRLSDTLLDVSRIHAGRLELAREAADLAALVREAVARVAQDAVEGGLEVTVDAPASVPCVVDPARADQIVTNLLSNALKYGQGRPVRVAVSAGAGLVRLEVADGGIGIAPQDQERIFGRFERAVSGRHYGGLGLGLWIVRRLVEAHGGTIRVASAPGAGSTFTVELPA